RVRAERLIATGRVVLAAFSLLAVWIAPPTPAGHTNATTLLLAAYLGYALVLALVAWFAYARVLRFGLLTHALDLALFSLFVYLTEGPASPFFTYFVFALVAATLRWQSRGALWTAAMAVLAFNAVGRFVARATFSTPLGQFWPGKRQTSLGCISPLGQAPASSAYGASRRNATPHSSPSPSRTRVFSPRTPACRKRRCCAPRPLGRSSGVAYRLTPSCDRGSACEPCCVRACTGNASTDASSRSTSARSRRMTWYCATSSPGTWPPPWITSCCPGDWSRPPPRK